MTIPHLLSNCRDGVTIMTSKKMDSVAKKVARRLQHKGVPIEYTRDCVIEIDMFCDGELCTTIRPNVRDKVVFLFWDFTPNDFNGHLNIRMRELEIALSALKYSSVREVVLIMPYYPYSRQERPLKRQPGSAKDFAETLEKFSIISHLVTFDLHVPQIAFFFNRIKVINIPGHVIFAPFFRKMFQKEIAAGQLQILATDVGGSKRARDCAEKTDAGLEIAVIDKRRDKDGSKAMKIIGTVSDTMIAYDDIGGTMGTLLDACAMSLEEGSKHMFGAITHNVCSPKGGTSAEAKIAAAGIPIFTLDTVPRGKKYYKKNPLITRIPYEKFMAGLILEIMSVDGSVGQLTEEWVR